MALHRRLVGAVRASVDASDFLWLQRESGLTKGTRKIPLTLVRLTGDGRRAFVQYRKRMNGLLSRT
jgi:hypothetical protein